MSSYIQKIFYIFISLLVASCASKPDDLSTFVYRDTNKPLTHKNVEHIVVFGDSISDRGNLFSVLNFSFNFSDFRLQSPPAAPYGLAFSNKRLIPERLAEYFNVDLIPFYFTRLNENKELILANQEAGGPVAKSANSHQLAMALLKPHTNFNHPINQETSDYLSKRMKYMDTLPVTGPSRIATNFSVVASGALDDSQSLSALFLNTVSLNKQVDTFMRSGLDINTDKTLFYIFSGSNDILRVAVEDTTLQAAKERISYAVSQVIKAARRIRQVNGRRILLIAPPVLSEIPYVQEVQDPKKRKKLIERTKALSKHFGDLLEQEYKKNFSPKHVAFLGSLDIEGLLKQWPANRRHAACTRDIAGSRFIKPHFVDGTIEFESKYVNGCTQERLEAGEFPFFDEIHPSAALVEKLKDIVIRFLQNSEILK